MKKQELTQELLKELLFYDPDIGVFTWKERPLSMFELQVKGNTWNSRFKEKQAGCISRIKSNVQVCINIKVLSNKYTGHELAYLYMTGSFPEFHIDCIDGDYTNLKYKNIRSCGFSDTQNKKSSLRKDNKSTGFIGVKKYYNKFIARIRTNGKTIHLGTFNTPEEAHAAYVNAKRQISPEFNML